jgi:glycosyltransferase involved in cell wall biosynthesis
MSASHDLRVLHVAPTPFFADRGCHLRIRGIVRGLEEQGADSVVCTYPIGRDVEGVVTVRCPPVPGYSQVEAGPSPFKYVADFLMLFTTARQIRRLNPDVLHCHLHEGVLIGWVSRWLAFRKSTPIVFDMQGSLTGELEAHGYFRHGSALFRLFAAIERFIVGRAGVYVCSSDASGRILSERFGVPRELVHIVPDGTDIPQPEHPPSDAPDTSRRAVAIYAGGLTETKGLGTLKRIIEETANRRSAIRFLIVGYPTADLERFLREKGLEDRCEVVGRVAFADLPDYFARAGLALEPKPAGSGEASGKLVNYMAGGLPVVCFDTENNRRILDGKGYLAPAGDVEAFVDRMEACVADPSVADEFARAGRARVQELYSWRLAGSKIVAAYRSVGVGPTAQAGDRDV